MSPGTQISAPTDILWKPLQDLPEKDALATDLTPLLGEAPLDPTQTSVCVIPTDYHEEVPIRIDRTTNHVLIIVKQHSRATLEECMDGDGDRDHTTVILLDENAHLDYTLLQNADASARISLRQINRIGPRASLRIRNCTLGGGEVDHVLHSTVTGDDAESTVDWVSYAQGKEKYALQATNIFHGKNGRGEMRMNGIAEEEAQLSCNGAIEIGLHGGGTDAYLTEHILMLDATAKVDAVPGLNICTNDVKASHSATMTKVSPEDIFYFASRGIAEEEARRMYIEGFLNEIMDVTSSEKLAEEFHKALIRKSG